MLVQQDIPVADEIDRLAPKKPIRSRPAKSRGARETGKGGVHRAVCFRQIGAPVEAVA